MKDINADRDASMDRLLASALNARAGEAVDGACLDAETLAAWADEALDASERAGVEAHAADCARCQALLAAMVKTAPPAVEARSWWRIPGFGWLVPLTVAAAALAIWIAVPNRVPVQISDGGAEIVDQVSPAPSTAPAVAPQKDATAPAQPDAQPQGQMARERESAAFAPSVDRLERRKTEALEKEAPPAEAKPKALSEAVAPPAAPLAGAAPASAPAFAPGAPPPSADSNAQRAAPAAPPRVSAFASPLETIVVSSNPATRFRLLRGGNVQRSADAGATWRTEVTGATDTLAAGASPSPSVCWLIGPAGTVLLSTGGSLWRRLVFPEAVDLRAISAADAENASVTTVDGREYVTSDGGRTWSRAPGF